MKKLSEVFKDDPDGYYTIKGLCIMFNAQQVTITDHDKFLDK